MIETPITDWNVVVAILFGLTIGIPAFIVGCIKAQIFLADKFRKEENGQSYVVTCIRFLKHRACRLPFVSEQSGQQSNLSILNPSDQDHHQFLCYSILRRVQARG